MFRQGWEFFKLYGEPVGFSLDRHFLVFTVSITAHESLCILHDHSDLSDDALKALVVMSVGSSSSSRWVPRTFFKDLFQSFGYDPDGAQKWLKEIERIFRVMQCSEVQKVRFGTHMLADEADDWWISLLPVLGRT
ncbi:hypothetical protein MTR_7g029390 [Medicago truncatula]|uniref:Uncharacterized protein n=1 Tax=Medicago truncatula TaxID=3880 RepID=A0A072TX91_MEDTR|nr:hypothetical protein MTR_7g029390 [Medicago truncatula]